MESGLQREQILPKHTCFMKILIIIPTEGESKKPERTLKIIASRRRITPDAG
jgi:hypothetical protein